MVGATLAPLPAVPTSDLLSSWGFVVAYKGILSPCFYYLFGDMLVYLFGDMLVYLFGDMLVYLFGDMLVYLFGDIDSGHRFML